MMRIMLFILGGFFLLNFSTIAEQQTWTLATPPKDAPVALIPYPQSVTWAKRKVSFRSCHLKITDFSKSDLATVIPELREVLSEGRVKMATSKGPGTVTLLMRKGEIENAVIPEEAYSLSVKAGRVELVASTGHGLFNGLQTLRQLITRNGSPGLPMCEITDWPAFRVRGFMHDLGRYYQSPDFLKEQLEILSRYKINTFHMHLTDDPAWRVEVKKYPALTAAEHHWKSRRPGKFYTQAELKDIVEFCAKRHINIIPEIDMPGHSKSFTRAIGHDMQTPQGMKVLQECLKEIIPIFPGKMIHIGSDEVGIKMESFMPEMVKFVRSFGKKVIVWSPGLRVDNDVINMHWGDHKGYYVNQKMTHIDTHGFYMDWIDSQSGVYQFFFQQPCDKPHGDERSLGAVACIWADGNLSGEDRVLKQYPFYPCMVTFAERTWRGSNDKRIDLFAKLPQPGTPAYEAFAEFERRLVMHRDLNFREQPFAYVAQSHIPWSVIGPFDHKGKNDTSFGPEKGIRENYKDGNKTLTWKEQPAWGGAIHFRHFYDVFNIHWGGAHINHWPAVMTDEVGKEDGTCYALTFIHSPKKQNIHLMFGIGGQWGHTGGYRAAMAPAQGEWDFSGGDVWLNGKRVPPPQWPFESRPWGGWGRGRIEDFPLTEEGYFFRPPVPIQLQKGKNAILVRVPFGWWKGDKGQRKWMFNCIPVTWDGKHYREVRNLKFSSLAD